MKRILPHPPMPARPNIWRSPAELENSPDFEQVLLREFPGGAEVYDESGVSKRDFIKLLGASMALAGIGLASCRRPEAYLVPLKEGVEWTIPGKFLYYATAMPTRLGAMPLIATTVDGRPTKLEGNPLHPFSNGGTDAFAQASILDLYDPLRAKDIKVGGKASDVAALGAFLAEVREKAATSGGEGVVVLVGAANSPTRDRLRDEIKAKYPQLIWAQYEALGDPERLAATSIALGEGIRLHPLFERADVIVALDSDFLNCSETGASYASGFYPRRQPTQGGASMNRLYVIENHYTITGGLADHRLRAKASDIGAFTRALAEKIAAKTGATSLARLVAAYPHSDAKFDDQWVSACADDLIANQGRGIVIIGPHQPWHAQLLVFAVNDALKNLGATIVATQTGAKRDATIQDVASAIHEGKVQTVFLLGGNPAYDAPAELDFRPLIAKVPQTLRLSLFEDETSKVSKWNVPAAHFLETWGDARSFDGTYTAIQPMILPLWGGISELEILAALAGRPKPEGPSLIKETFQLLTQSEGDAFLEKWHDFLRNGFLQDSAWEIERPNFDLDACLAEIEKVPPASTMGTEIVFIQSSSVDDGRYANNSWLQETPDFVTKLTWDNAALLSPAFAKSLGIEDGDVVEISAGDKTIRAAALGAPGHADDSITIALGYGRKEVSALIENAGFDAYPLRDSGSTGFRTGIAVRKASAPKYQLAMAQETHSMYGRDLFREAPLSRYQAEPDFAASIGMDSHLPPNNSLYRNPYFQPNPSNTHLPAREQWAMTIDLNTCTGCNACVVACQAENNVPVVGKDQVIKGRDMAWIRIDRYFAVSPEDVTQDNDATVKMAENPEMLAQTILCQHCENAPCETVCPVNATVHNDEGLNLMAYNRCIGTRYCANNCPWKVRRFNYFDYNQRPLDQLYFGPLAEKGLADSLKMSKNPNVTVRMRGVMEKCTFCIQRIEEAKIARLVEAGPTDKNRVPIGNFKAACQQACPADSIVFGNEADENSRVARLRKDPRGYGMLKYLNTRPRVTYLARIKNPNANVPGAAKVGLINTPSHHSGHHPVPDHEHAVTPEAKEEPNH